MVDLLCNGNWTVLCFQFLRVRLELLEMEGNKGKWLRRKVRKIDSAQNLIFLFSSTKQGEVFFFKIFLSFPFFSLGSKQSLNFHYNPSLARRNPKLYLECAFFFWSLALFHFVKKKIVHVCHLQMLFLFLSQHWYCARCELKRDSFMFPVRGSDSYSSCSSSNSYYTQTHYFNHFKIQVTT